MRPNGLYVTSHGPERSQNFWAGNDFCISNSPSKMTKPEVLGILGLDVGDKFFDLIDPLGHRENYQNFRFFREHESFGPHGPRP